jgi:hypothetical protein
MQDDVPVNLAQLELAVRICSRPAAQGGAVLRKRVTWWGRWTFAFRAVWWGRNLEQEHQNFRDYLNACCTQPEVMGETDGSGKSRVMPSLLTMLTHLSSQGFDMKEVGGAWPAGLADWIYLTSVASHSDVKFLTDEDRVFQEGLRARKAMQERRAREKAEEEERSGVSRAVRVLREVLGRG